jgi:hypothetical protein
VSRGSRRLRQVPVRLVREFWETLVLMGRLSGGDPTVHAPSVPEPSPAPPLRPAAGPPPDHPERLVSGVGPDACERALWADILDRELDA